MNLTGKTQAEPANSDAFHQLARAHAMAAAVAWEKESKVDSGIGNYLYVETVGYLIPLLDSEKSAKEIAVMNERKERLLALPRMITPLIIPVGKDNDVHTLIDHAARVRFDLDGSGRQLEWPWITNDAAWLTFDPHKAPGRLASPR